MTITYRNEFRDWVAFQAYFVPRNPILILTSVGFFLLVTFQGFLPALREMPAGQPLIGRIIGFILVELLLIAFIVAFLAVITILPTISRKNKLLYCKRTLSTGDDTFFTESEYSRSETKWSAVQKLVRTRSHIFMFLSQHNAVVVPRSAFEAVEKWDEFYEACRRNQAEQDG